MRGVPDCRWVRSWFVIPAMGVACGGAAVALGMSPVLAITGAAIAAVIRVRAGESPAALTGAVLAPLLAIASFADAGGELPRAAIALAAAAWTLTELAREDGAPRAAVLPAVIAGVLDPSFIGLVAIAGARLVTAPGPEPEPEREPNREPERVPDRSIAVQTIRITSRGGSPASGEPRPRWALAVPVAGVLAIVLAVVAGTVWPALGVRWFGSVAQPSSLARVAALAGATLGPLTAVAALAGLGDLVRVRLAELALGAAIAGAVLVDLRSGALGPATIGLAALLAGLAIVRLAAMIRLASGQAIAAATIGVLVIVPPAWTAIAHRSAAAHIAHASR